MKPISLGDSLARLRDFPDEARSEAGYQLSQVQLGHDPYDWKPMKTVGPGVREIRVREASGAFRVIWLTVADDGERIGALEATMKAEMDKAVGSLGTLSLGSASLVAFLVGCASTRWGMLSL